MMELIQYIVNTSTNFISNGGYIVGFILVLLESFIPMLPLSLFVALNVNSFGFIEGVIISWIATSIGSIICYIFFYNYCDFKRIKYYNINKFNNISFTKLVLIITLPFTPSFIINIISGISKMSFDKYILSILIGKCFTIIFWGYIGSSLINSITNINSIIYILFTLLIAYIISKVISYRFDIK